MDKKVATAIQFAVWGAILGALSYCAGYLDGSVTDDDISELDNDEEEVSIDTN